MKISKFLQVRVVQSNDPQQFQQEFNKVQQELARLKPETIYDISSDLYKALIQYEVTEEIPETAEEVLAEQGLSFSCENCPKFMPALNNDGSIKRTAKHGSCFLEQRVCRNAPACDWFCREILKGNINATKGVE